mmetsp:Transcript_7787/g.13055  ORF Transcript_7787/g.13055 Transcript_7787/m.13055 type:complete len:165 (+) Transcript_7787:598-1092(+)
MLRCSMSCAILCPAGSQKFKILSILHKDERGKEIDPHYNLLDMIFKGQIIRKADFEEFEQERLEEHQQVVGPDGYSCLQRAMLEHNILMLSKIYLNISLESMGEFLNIEADKAEQIIGDMIFENRIRAKLDQRASTVYFDVEFGGKGIEVAGASQQQQDSAAVD